MRSRVTPVRLQGQKVVLREKRITDAANDYAWSTDPELSRLDAASPMKLTFQHALMLYEEELAYPTNRRQRFAIDTIEGEHIGNCMFYDINESKGETELGIMVGERRYWGKSYGTDAVRTLLRYVFTQTRLRRVYLHTLDWNVRAQKSFEKAGFTPTGHVKRGGYNFVAMEVHKADWERRMAAEKEAAEADAPQSPDGHTPQP